MASTPNAPWMTFYDAQGLAFGVLMASLGVVFLQAAGLVTGQTAGLAVLLSYVARLEFGMLFLAISLPFMVVAWTQRGAVFTFRTGLAVAGISALTPVLAHHMAFQALPGLLAAILAGACAGVGLIALFRHNASAGGLGVLALVIETRTGLKAGWFQLIFDAGVFAAALFVLSPFDVAYSFIGAVVLNLIIAWNFHVGQTEAPVSNPGK